MVALEVSERQVHYTASAPASKRYIMYSYFMPTERYIWMQYSLTRLTQRTCFVQQGRAISDRTIYFPRAQILGITSRTIMQMEPLPAQEERYCMFTPGAQNIMFTCPVNVPFTCSSSVPCFCCIDPISNRQVMFTLGLVSEKQIFACFLGESKISTPVVHFALTFHSDVGVYVETWDRNSQRYIMFSVTATSEKFIWLQLANRGYVSSPTVKLAIARLGTERYVCVQTIDAHSERYCTVLVMPYTERTVSFTFTSHTDRYITYVTAQARRLHSFYVISARPMNSERYITYKAIVYNTERLVFAETREMHFVKTPDAMGANRVVRVNTDAQTQISMRGERTVLVGGQVSTEVVTDVMKTKAILGSTSSRVEFTMTDNYGASISQDSTIATKRTLLWTAPLRLSILEGD